jgi:hypothetical protein
MLGRMYLACSWGLFILKKRVRWLHVDGGLIEFFLFRFPHSVYYTLRPGSSIWNLPCDSCIVLLFLSSVAVLPM